MSDIQSEQLDKFLPAFLKAQKAMKPAAKDAKNPAFGKAKYASLASVLEAVMPSLWDNDFVLTHQTERVLAGSLLITKIIHISGQWIGSVFPIAEEVTVNPQKMGSAITYGRRYNTLAITNIAAEDDDDDGNHASGRQGITAPAPARNGLKHVYAMLSETLRLTKTQDEYKAWKAKHQEAISALDEEHFKLMQQLVVDHRATFQHVTGEAAPATAKTPAKNLSMADRAIAVERDKNAPMPDDEIRYD